MFGPIGITELMIILVIIMIIFGAGRLPEIGKGLGSAIQNFRKSMREPPEIDVTPRKDEPKIEEKSQSSNEGQPPATT